MTTVELPARSKKKEAILSFADFPPPLQAGDHLSRTEFERRYQAAEQIKKAELVEGVVYMPSPARFEKHGRPHSDIIGWLFVYRAATPHLFVGDNAAVRLDRHNEVQPDGLLRVEEAAGGQSIITADDYVQGAPELVVEIAASSAAYDLYEKKLVYARNGVQEYIVVQMLEGVLEWFVLGEDGYEPIPPNEQGILKSVCFPGLWLDVEGFWRGDAARLLQVLQEGIASPEHQAFVARERVGIKS